MRKIREKEKSRRFDLLKDYRGAMELTMGTGILLLIILMIQVVQTHQILMK